MKGIRLRFAVGGLCGLKGLGIRMAPHAKVFVRPRQGEALQGGCQFVKFDENKYADAIREIRGF